MSKRRRQHNARTVGANASRRASVSSPQSAPHRQIRREITRRSLHTLLRILCVLTAAFVLVVLLTDPAFQVRSIVVTGLKTIPRNRVDPIVQILEGQNLFRAPTWSVHRQLLSLLEIQEARVHRNTRREIVVEVVERRPFAALPIPPQAKGPAERADLSTSAHGVPSSPAGDGTLSLQNPSGYTIIDAEGLAYKRINHPAPGTVVYRGPQQNSLQVGGHLGRNLLENLHRSLRYCKESGLPRPVTVCMDSLEAVTLEFEDQLVVRLGHDRWKEKLLLAHRTLDYIERQGKVAELIDLRTLEAPSWKPKEMRDNEPRTGSHTDGPAASAAKAPSSSARHSG